MDNQRLHLRMIVVGLILVGGTFSNDDKNHRDGNTEVANSPSSSESAIQIVPDAEVEDQKPDQESFIQNRQPFIPSKDWQPVAEGQAIPHGLHVRLNLETGEREARLLDEEGSAQHKTGERPTNKMDWFKASVQEAVRDLEAGKADDHPSLLDSARTLDLKKSAYTREELKEALKKFKAMQDDVKTPTIEDVAAKTKFRSIDEIQTDFKNLGMNIKMDSEITSELFKRYQARDISDAEKINILSDFEYYLHQIDNAVNFADMGGLGLLLKDLNSTNSEVRGEAALVLASALQSNPKVQISALESGSIHQLLRLLTLDISPMVRVRALAALSSLVRHFPHAQLKFIELGGVQALTPLIRDFISPESQRLAIKALTLVNDLLLEKLQARIEETPDQTLEQRQLRIMQYDKVQILESVVQQGWCQSIPELLNLSEHDTREKVLGIMSTLREACVPHFNKFRQILETLRTEYSSLAVEEESSGDEYFKGLLTVIERLMSEIVDIKNTEL